MAQVEVPMGEMQIPPEKHSTNSTNGFEFLQLPQLPLGQIGYPQAHNWIEHRKANIRPWALFLNTNNIRPPPNISRLSKRIVKNIEYFQSNYLFVFIGLVIYCLITSPLLLLTVVASLGICYKLSQRHSRQELMILNHRLTLAQVYSLVGICSLPIFYLVGAHAAVFWVLGRGFLVYDNASRRLLQYRCGTVSRRGRTQCISYARSMITKYSFSVKKIDPLIS